MNTLFAKNCEVLRKLKNWKQSEIEGFSVSTWSNYENARSVPGFDDLIKISKLFEVSIDDLLFSDLSKNIQGKPQRVKKYSIGEEDQKLSIVEDKGDSIEAKKSVLQKLQRLENRLAKLEKIVEKIVDKL